MNKSRIMVVLMCLLFISNAKAVPQIEIYGTEGELNLLPETVGISFEDYVGVSPTGGKIQQPVSDANTFLFPSGDAEPIGLLIGAAFGETPVKVYYTDFASGTYAADIGGPAISRPASGSYGDRLIFKFVALNYHDVNATDPNIVENPIKAAVTGVGFRWGSIPNPSEVEIRFYDVDDNEITPATSDVTEVPPFAGGLYIVSTRSYIAMDNGVPVPIIHKVVIEYTGYINNDLWCVGNYNDSQLKNDMSYYMSVVDLDISVQQPNGGQPLVAGQTYQLQWDENYLQQWDATATSATSCGVDIEFSSDNGATWSLVYPENSGNTGTYDWKVPDVSSTQCLIRVSDVCDDRIYGMSNLFTIQQCQQSDLTGDCQVDMLDLAELASEWLQ